MADMDMGPDLEQLKIDSGLGTEYNGTAYDDADMGAQESLSRSRWVVLSLFCLVMACNQLAWNMFADVGDIALIYYGGMESYFDIQLLSMIYMIVYLPFCFVGAFVVAKTNLRIATIGAAFLNTLGALLKVSKNKNIVLVLSSHIIFFNPPALKPMTVCERNRCQPGKQVLHTTCIRPDILFICTVPSIRNSIKIVFYMVWCGRESIGNSRILGQ